MIPFLWFSAIKYPTILMTSLIDHHIIDTHKADFKWKYDAPDFFVTYKEYNFKRHLDGVTCKMYLTQCQYKQVYER